MDVIPAKYQSLVEYPRDLFWDPSYFFFIIVIIIIIGVFWMQDAVILFAQIFDSSSEFLSKVVLDRLIIPEFIKSVFKNSHTGCCYYFPLSCILCIIFSFSCLYPRSCFAPLSPPPPTLQTNPHHAVLPANSTLTSPTPHLLPSCCWLAHAPGASSSFYFCLFSPFRRH